MFGLFTKKAVGAEPIYFTNSATGEKEAFKPLKPGKALMYTCGPTVYDHGHIGNLASYLLPDLIKRVLEYNGYSVKNTINFTDFGHLSDDGDAGEDKMMKALKRADLPITLENMKRVAEIYIESFKDDNLAFRNLPPTHYTPASEYVQEQIALIKTLVEKGYGYETSDGVYFDISKYPEYGVLGNVDVEKMKAGARVEENPEKKHPADFALWKKGDLGWDSAWGKGFPGWHTECTAMIFSTLGKQIDIHTGGEDLKYTHHNGEIAQAECACGKRYVNYWLHNSHVLFGGEKLAKSTGNIIRLQDLLDKGYAAEDYRYWLLTSHYRTSPNFTFEALDAAKTARERALKQLYETYDGQKGQIIERYQIVFRQKVNDDLDTPGAVALLWEMLKDTEIALEDKVATARDFDQVLALGLADNPEDIKSDIGALELDTLPEEIQQLVNEREAARTIQNWPEADRLRDAIVFKGYEIEDSGDGPKITKAGQ